MTSSPDVPDGLDPETAFAIERALRSAGLAAAGGAAVGLTASVGDPPDPSAAEAGDLGGGLDLGGAADSD